MSETPINNKSSLLLLSHCLPNAMGNNHEVRAWQLLKIASSRYRVTLLCTTQREVHLCQWQAIKNLAEKVAVHRPSVARQMASRVLSVTHRPTADRVLSRTDLTSAALEITGEQSFDVLICTHPAIYSNQLESLAETIICDLARPLSTEHLLLSHTSGMAAQWWHRNQSKHYLAMETQASKCSDLILLADDDHWQRLYANHCHARVLPQQLDTHQLQTFALADEDYPLKVAVHVDFSNRQARREVKWFVRHIWRSIQAELGDVELLMTDQSNPRTVETLGRSSLIVVPVSDPKSAHLSIYQGMSACRPVVAATAGAEGLNAKPGAHLQLASTRQDWVNTCVNLLRSKTLRNQIAVQGRELIEQQFGFHASETHILDNPDMADRPLNLVAHAA